MGGTIRRIAVLATVALASACSSITGIGDEEESDLTITTEAEAEAAYNALRYVAQAIDQQVGLNFSTPFSVSGQEGTANVWGSKTHTTTSSSSSSTTTDRTDIYIGFIQYKSGGTAISGTVRWYDYYYSRTACSSSYCATASDHSESMEGTVIDITFEYNGKRYTDTISVDAYSGADSSRWDVELRNGSGMLFSFYHY